MHPSRFWLPAVFVLTATVTAISDSSVQADPLLRIFVPNLTGNEHPAPAEAVPFAAKKHVKKRRDFAQSPPYYPIPGLYFSALDNREKILSAPAGNNWSFEVKKLVDTPATVFTSVEGNDYHASSITPKDTIARDKVEHDNLTPEQLSSLSTARQAATNEAAYEAGKNLPPALRAYTAGAVAFNQSDFPHALTYFSEAQAANDAPAQMTYQVWATFMLGRTYAKTGADDKAKNAFIQVRDMVTKGAHDPLGLAAESYGEEARLALDEAGGVLGEEKFNPDQSGRKEHFREAVRLYMLQAQTGSHKGMDSLHILCKEIKNQPSDFTLLTQDEMIRRLFLAYVRGYHRYPEFLSYAHSYSRSSGGVEERGAFITSLLKLFPPEDKDIADQLAAAALEIDNFDLAHHYAEQKPSALSTWIKARLALHMGDKEKAADLYEKATEQQQQETTHSSLDPHNEAIAHERAILTLARGQFVKSFEEFYSLHDISDFHFVANRILTIDELKQFVKAHAEKEQPVTQLSSDPEEQNRIFYNQFKAETLTLLTAHRLMRMGRYHEAVDYFPVKKGNQNPTEHELAQSYVGWLDTSGSAYTDISKAEALYQAATLMRQHGDDLLGYELIQLESPDADLSGNPYVTQEERDRLLASHAETSLPHSFRKIATIEAIQASNLLPSKSQAYAAVLCHATQWIRPADNNQAQDLYHLYVSKGAIVPWATHFGHHCPTPDFTMARYENIRRVFIWIKLAGHRHPAAAATAFASVMLLAGGGILFSRRRKHNKTISA